MFCGRSGGLGGFVFILIGWAIPSAINLLLSAWIVSYVRAFWSLRLAVFLIVSFLLGVNLSLPNLVGKGPPRLVTVDILRPIAVTADTPLDDRLMVVSQSPLNATPAPSPLGVNVSADEGCGCMYFRYDGRDYYNQLKDVVERVSQVRRNKRYYFFEPPRFTNAIHFDVEFTQSVAAGHMVDVTVNVYDGLQKTATYSQYNLPVPAIDEQSVGRRKPLMSDHFYEYCASILMRQNFWMWMLEDRLRGKPISAFEGFLSSALHVT